MRNRISTPLVVEFRITADMPESYLWYLWTTLRWRYFFVSETNSVSSLGLNDLQGENSVSSFQPILCVPSLPQNSASSLFRNCPVLPFLGCSPFTKENLQMYQGFSVPAERIKTLKKNKSVALLLPHQAGIIS